MYQLLLLGSLFVILVFGSAPYAPFWNVPIFLLLLIWGNILLAIFRFKDVPKIVGNGFKHSMKGKVT